MRQPASIDPFTPSPETQVPHPMLRAALENLDVQLEEELIRYRRQQRLQLDPSRHRPSAVKPYAFDSKIPARPARDGVQLPNVRALFNLESTGELPIGNSAASENPVKAILGNAVGSPLPQPASSQPASSQPFASPLVPPMDVSRLQGWRLPVPPVPSESSPSTGISSYAQQFELSAHPPDAALQRLSQSQDSGTLYTQPSMAPEGYLESSEELLKSIEEEDTSLRVQRRADLLDTLLTPLGIGSMLLLLLSSVTLGYVIMNPASLIAFWAPAPQPNPATDSSSPLTHVPTTPIDVAPPSPDLAAQEFKDLNLDTLSTLPGAERRSPVAPKPNAAAPATPRRPQSSSRAPAASDSSAPPAEPQSSYAAPAVVQQSELPAIAVQSAPPAPAPIQRSSPVAPAVTRTLPASPAPEVATAPISQPPDNLYYVGTDYSGDSSLQQARVAVPDAYVRNLPAGGAKVQLGAFSNEAAAQERVQELQQQGIAAQVYRP